MAHVGKELALGQAGALGLLALLPGVGQRRVQFHRALAHHAPQVMAVLRQLLAVELLQVHVADQPGHAQAAGRVRRGAAAGAEPAPLAVGAAQAVGALPGARRRRRARHLGRHRGTVVRVHPGHVGGEVRRGRARRVAQQARKVVADDELVGAADALEVGFQRRVERALEALRRVVGGLPGLALGVHVGQHAAQALERWVGHLLGVQVQIEPVHQVADSAWRWHVGLDVESTAILNDLYQDRPVDA